MDFLCVELQRAVIPMAIELCGMIVHDIGFSVFYIGHYQHTLGIGNRNHQQPPLSY